ncbi:hypothetical protein A3C26_03065 [Candidatus Daviesbacteria bacterium RIFCSPHIGHO2_02_FULL_39_12]|uniref:DUF1648 domain-containing protein n=2 Tax=Candidatus Daviesiibacteriota TaxID=1752718 RepID=A0A1F5JE84_9BACT|nr:MAG: hypothetical protein A3C26_03065 [Candidatus Daviesbacteria bacterium RIFCSPHIGHO2_02_FULL_39_12]OGE71434.1 MAG: hypothetical protein A3H40_02815 [Candidatus Daviesbacteria bacterium RIFCSPLOWO2_02_FULL_38_15]
MKLNRANQLNLIPAFCAGLIAASILILDKSLPPKLPLFYSLPWGDAQLASPQQLFIIPSVIILITLLNLTISRQLHYSQGFFKKVLLFYSLLTAIILTITFFKIVFIFI